MRKPTVDRDRPAALPAAVRYRWPALLLALAMAALAAPAAPADTGAEEVEELLEELEDRYQIFPLSDGYLLRPEDADAGIDQVEVQSEKVLVDGDLASEAELEDLLGDDAETVFELAGLIGEASWERQEQHRQELEDRARDLEDQARERAERAERARERAERRRKSHSGDKVWKDTQVTVLSGLTIEEDEYSETAVVVGSSLEVLGEVQGDAVVVFGSVEVRGEVHGGVTAVGGSVFLGPDALVGGDVTSIGGSVDRDRGARIHGQISEVAFGPLMHGGVPWSIGWWPRWSAWSAWGDAMVLIFNASFLTAIILLTVFVARQRVERVARQAEAEPWRAGLAGLAVQVFFLPAFFVVFVILCISIIGIPLALLLFMLAPIGLVLVLLLGYAGVALNAGRWLEDRFGLSGLNTYLLVLLGILLIQGWSILGEGMGFVGGPIRVTAIILVFLGFLLKYVVWTVGLGAVVLSRRSGASPVPVAGPPVPPPPPDDDEPARSWDEAEDGEESSAEHERPR